MRTRPTGLASPSRAPSRYRKRWGCRGHRPPLALSRMRTLYGAGAYRHLNQKKQVETVGGGPGLCSARTITRIRMAASPTSMRTTILRIRTRTTGLASPTEVRKRKGRTDGKESCGNSMGRRGRPQQSRIPSSLTTPSAIVKEVENHVRVAKAVSRLHSPRGGKVNENGRPQKMKAARCEASRLIVIKNKNVKDA